jgi:hypothetical protein
MLAIAWKKLLDEMSLESAPVVHSDVKRPRELWRDYAAVFSDDRAKELYTNVIVFDCMRKGSQEVQSAPKRPRIDARCMPDEPMPSMSLSRVAGLASAHTPTALRAILGHPDTPPPFFRVVQRFLSDLLPGGYPKAGVFDTERWSGVGYLRPDCAPEGGDVSTLELHREVVALEQAGACLLQYVLRAFVEADARKTLPREDVSDAEIAFEFQGGVEGDGALYWVGGSAVAPTCAFADTTDPLSLYHIVCYLHANRAEAFKRRYVVADDGTWGLPVTAALFLLHDRKAGAPASLEEVTGVIESLTKQRRAAVHADRTRLLRYGAHLTHYCMRLQLILRKLLITVPPIIAVARFSGDPDGFVIGVQVTHAAPPAEHVDDQAVVQAQLEAEAAQIKETLRIMGLEHSDALDHVRVITKGVQAAMATDGHLRNQTRFLHPSLSLSGAQYAAYMYGVVTPVE